MKVIYNDGHVAECPEDEELHVTCPRCARQFSVSRQDVLKGDEA